MISFMISVVLASVVLTVAMIVLTKIAHVTYNENKDTDTVKRYKLILYVITGIVLGLVFTIG